MIKEKFGYFASKIFFKLQSGLFGISAFCYKMGFSGLVFLGVCLFCWRVILFKLSLHILLWTFWKIREVVLFLLMEDILKSKASTAGLYSSPSHREALLKAECFTTMFSQRRKGSPLFSLSLPLSFVWSGALLAPLTLIYMTRTGSYAVGMAWFIIWTILLFQTAQEICQVDFKLFQPLFSNGFLLCCLSEVCV